MLDFFLKNVYSNKNTVVQHMYTVAYHITHGSTGLGFSAVLSLSLLTAGFMEDASTDFTTLQEIIT